MSWHILRAAPRSEFKIRDELHWLGLSALVPVEFSVASFGKGREAIRKAPIVRGYVFADVSPRDWSSIAAIREVKGAMLINDRPATLHASEVEALELLSKPLHRPNSSRLRPGDQVAIRRGAFASLRGVVDRIEKNGKVVAMVELFGKWSEVKLRPQDLEAA